MDDAPQIPARAVPLPPPGHEAIHRGIADAPFVELGEGNALQLLQVDLNQGLWIVRTRFAPGYQVQTHYHTGAVFAVTEQGRWYYEEYPSVVNSPGSYLYEPAGSLHTLTIPKDQDGPTQVWFAIYGANVNIDAAGQVISVTDAHTILPAYRALCAAQGIVRRAGDRAGRMTFPLGERRPRGRQILALRRILHYLRPLSWKAV